MDPIVYRGRGLPLATAPLVPVTVNLHILRECNYACSHCFAGFPGVKSRLSREDALELVARLCSAPPILGRYVVRKLTFAGGEPTLHPDLPEFVRAADLAGVTTCVVTNGYRLADNSRLRLELGPHLHWLAVSLDGPDEETNLAHGRGRGDALARVLATVRYLRAAHPSLRLKVNTVVTALNWSSCMLDVIAELRPERWKVLQVTHLEGENDATYPALAVTPEQFADFVARHRRALPAGVELVPEREGQIQGSYLMVDPEGHLFCNVGGKEVRGPSLLSTSLEDAVRAVGWNPEAFVERGGAYDWGRQVSAADRPVLVAVEGLDGSGKSTTTQALARALNAVLVTNPPESFRAERAAADRRTEADRRAWYREGNFAAQREADAHRAQGRSVVFDRSFASTAAFGSATAGGVASAGDWPASLKRPDLIVLLDVDEVIRCARLDSRGGASTPEEQWLRNDEAFRTRVLQGLKALGAVAVDASRPVEEVVAQILNLLGR